MTHPSASSSTDKGLCPFFVNFYAIRLVHISRVANHMVEPMTFAWSLWALPSTVRCGSSAGRSVTNCTNPEQRKRSQLEWGDMAYEPAESHTEIKRWQLNRLMGIDTTTRLLEP
jgi:hypothetical protein